MLNFTIRKEGKNAIFPLSFFPLYLYFYYLYYVNDKIKNGAAPVKRHKKI